MGKAEVPAHLSTLQGQSNQGGIGFIFNNVMIHMAFDAAYKPITAGHHLCCQINDHPALPQTLTSKNHPVFGEEELPDHQRFFQDPFEDCLEFLAFKA